MIPFIDQWAIFSGCIVGYIYGSKKFKEGQRVLTEAIMGFNSRGDEVYCYDGLYRLGQEGNLDEHKVTQPEKKVTVNGLVINV